MPEYDPPSSLEAVRANPVQCGLFVLVPALVAVVQLLNTVVNGLSPTISVPFAAVLLIFTTVVLRYQIASLRLATLEAHVESLSREGTRESR